MSKFFVNRNQIIEDEYVNIVGTDVNHIKNVLRYDIGKKLDICCKEDSKNYSCEIQQIESDRIICKIIEEKNDIESNVVLDVYQGLPKFDKMELIIQKGTELGVHSFIPVKMKRSIVKLDDKDATKKVERWNKISEVAAKQSLRSIVPVVEMPLKVNDVVNRISDYDSVILAYEEEKNRYVGQELLEIKEKCSSCTEIKVAIIIGPEGGLDSEEVQTLKENGAKVVSLGKRILRTETASMQLSSIIMYELENRS